MCAYCNARKTVSWTVKEMPLNAHSVPHEAPVFLPDILLLGRMNMPASSPQALGHIAASMKINQNKRILIMVVQ